MVSSAHPNEISGTMRSVARQLQQKKVAYKKALQSTATRAIVENYREKRREKGRKMREQERRERKKVEMRRCRNDSGKFYQKIEHLTEGYKPGASFR